MQLISPEAMMALRAQGRARDLIDVRTPAEFGSVHAEGASNVPLDKLDAAAVLAGHSGDAREPIYLICKSGGRSAQAVAKFEAAGFANAISVDGGTQAWEAAGLPVIRGGKALPLDRQVQLVAGLMALSGVVLGTWVNAWFYLLAAMVGCGMTLAGLTGFCGMGILLAKMPWNQGSSCCSMCAPAKRETEAKETVQV